jgi:hypothetical protein
MDRKLYPPGSSQCRLLVPNFFQSFVCECCAFILDLKGRQSEYLLARFPVLTPVVVCLMMLYQLLSEQLTLAAAISQDVPS